MNAGDPHELVPVTQSAEPDALVTSDVSEATLEALRSARAAATRRVYAMHVRAFGAWLEDDVFRATLIDAANYFAGPGAEKSHSWRAQAAAAIKSAFDEAGLALPTIARRRTLQGVRRQRLPGPEPGCAANGSGNRSH